MTDDAPNSLAAKTESPADKQRSRMEKLLGAVEARSEMLTTLLAETGITFERFLEVFRRALIRNPDLIEADAGSVVEACINACTDGLLPDGRQGAIVIYNVRVSKRGDPDRWAKRANWQIMYQGLLDIAYSSGNFRSIECRVVYDGDAFEYDLGDEPFIKHRPKTRAAGTKQPAIIAAYAVARTVNGGVFREVFEGADIEKVNKVSRATNGPAKDWPEEMARKGPLRRIWKFLPKNEAMNRIIDRDNEGFDLGAMDLAELPARATKLAPGFAQIEQGADPVMPEVKTEPEAMPADIRGGAEPEMNRAREAETPGNPGASPALSEDTEADTEADYQATIPEVVAFDAALAAAGTWRIVRNALETFQRTELGASDWGYKAALFKVWARMGELRGEGKDKTDFISDPILFEAWLTASDPVPDRESIEGNWAIVQQDKAFEKLGAEDQARIAARVTEALGETDAG